MTAINIEVGDAYMYKSSARDEEDLLVSDVTLTVRVRSSGVAEMTDLLLRTVFRNMDIKQDLA